MSSQLPVWPTETAAADASAGRLSVTTGYVSNFKKLLVQHSDSYNFCIKTI